MDAALKAIERRVTDALAREKRWARHSGLWRLTVSDVARALDDKYPTSIKDYTYDSGARLDAWARCLEGAGASRRDADADLGFEEERRRVQVMMSCELSLRDSLIHYSSTDPDNGLLS